MILIIIIISLSKSLLSYIANTSRTHACTHARTNTRAHTRTHSRTCTHPPTVVAVQVVAVRRVGATSHDGVNAQFSPVPLENNGRLLLHSNKHSRWRLGIPDRFRCFSRIKKCLGRTEARTHDGMCFQSIRTV